MLTETRHVYKFGDFSLDATTKVVLRDGEPIRLARKAVETLLVLLEHPDQVLTKDELMGAIWQGRVVDEANLVQNIAVVRRTLRVAPGSPGYIETFSGRGYRLVGPILEGEEPLHGPDRLTAAPLPDVETVEPVLQMPAKPMSAAAQPAKSFPGQRSFRLTTGLVLAAVGTLWFAYFTQRHIRSNVAEDFRRSAVARLGGKECQPAISADGQSIAFVLDRNDGRRGRIWFRAGNRARAVTIGKDGWDYSSPVWSPDARSLAFLRFSQGAGLDRAARVGDRGGPGQDSGELVIVSVDAAKERVVGKIYPTRFGLPNRHLDWSSSGQFLAVDDTLAAEDPLGIFVVSVATGERRRVSTAPYDSVGDVDPRFSPDGKHVSFIRVFHRARQGLFTVRSDGTGLRRMSTDTFQISGQDWTGDGRALIMGSNRTGEFRLWRIPSDKGETAPSADSTGVYGDAPIQLSIARRDHVLVYAQLRENFNIWRLDLNAASTDRWKAIVNSSAQDASPQYSPEGKQICFRSDRTGDERLWVSGADGSAPQQVTTGGLRPSVGRWSPDGRSIVFNDSRDGDLYRAKRDAADNWQTVSLPIKGTHPVFSPDGRWIFAGWNDLIFKIPTSGDTTPITVAAVRGLSFGTSPDGRALYFVRKVVDPSLWEVSLKTGKISKVLEGLVPYCTSCWAAAPGGLYYLGGNRLSANGQAIYFHNLSTGRDKLIAEYPEPLLPLGSGPFSLSPDGRYLLCVRVDPSNSDVMRIEPYQ